MGREGWSKMSKRRKLDEMGRLRKGSELTTEMNKMSERERRGNRFGRMNMHIKQM